MYRVVKSSKLDAAGSPDTRRRIIQWLAISMVSSFPRSFCDVFTSFLVTMQKSLFAFGVKKITPKHHSVVGDLNGFFFPEVVLRRRAMCLPAKKGLRQYRNLCNGSCATLHVTPCARQTCANVTLHGLTAATYIASTVLFISPLPPLFMVLLHYGALCLRRRRDL